MRLGEGPYWMGHWDLYQFWRGVQSKNGNRIDPWSQRCEIQLQTIGPRVFLLVQLSRFYQTGMILQPNLAGLLYF
ncbi:hypothetical protein GJAV_G00091130 [Gymnothorax javanicus]|nr:hypothetical protein GJAV_G00091130 [Gymnothorax javanicus]